MKTHYFFIILISVFSNLSQTQAEDLSFCLKGWNATTNAQYESALKLYKDCIKNGDLTKASKAQTYRNIGITYSRMKQYKKAIEFYNNSLRLDPEDSWNDLVNRGNAWDELGDGEKALSDYQEALEKKKICIPLNKDIISIVFSVDCGNILYNRGIHYEKQKQLKLANQDFNNAYKFGLRSDGLIDRLNVYKKLSLESN